MQQRIQDGSLGRKAYHMDLPIDLQFVAEKAHPGYWDADQLYDLEKDPAEKENLAKDPQYAAVLAEMKTRLGSALAPLGRAFGEFGP